MNSGNRTIGVDAIRGAWEGVKKQLTKEEKGSKAAFDKWMAGKMPVMVLHCHVVDPQCNHHRLFSDLADAAQVRADEKDASANAYIAADAMRVESGRPFGKDGVSVIDSCYDRFGCC